MVNSYAERSIGTTSRDSLYVTAYPIDASKNSTQTTPAANRIFALFFIALFIAHLHKVIYLSLYDTNISLYILVVKKYDTNISLYILVVKKMV